MADSPATQSVSNIGGFDPFSYLTQSIGLPQFILTAMLPQLNELTKRFPRLFRTLGLLIALRATYSYIGKKLKKLTCYTLSICARSVRISENDELMGCFRRWLDHQRLLITREKSVIAQSLHNQRQFKMQGVQEDVNFWSRTMGNLPESFSLERSYQVYIFRHRGRSFCITHTKVSRKDYTDRVAEIPGSILIWTFGRSVKPIAEILADAVKNHSNEGESLATTLYTPTTASDWDGRRSSGAWTKHAVRPCRPISTVYLEGDQRNMIQKDVRRFLHPDTAARYRSKGIPHRRGYLFYGPPGNGKSSLAMALAGHFGLNVYSLSLRSSLMSDVMLASLFNVLPTRQVLVLFEDIDSAGLKREEEFDDDDEQSYYEDDGWGPRPGAKARRKTSANVTLSGVLNAIDGISAPEGHVLIMTTNAPENLDKALIRPGRIDVKIEFKNASLNQLQEIFFRMYRDESPKSEVPTDINVTSEIADASQSSVDSKLVQEKNPTTSSSITDDVLQTMAEEFSTSIPALEVSVAEVQNYLLGHVDEPQRAIDEASQWIRELQEEKAAFKRRKEKRAVKKQMEKEEMKRKAAERREMMAFMAEEKNAAAAIMSVGSASPSHVKSKVSAVAKLRKSSGKSVTDLNGVLDSQMVTLNGTEGVNHVSGFDGTVSGPGWHVTAPNGDESFVSIAGAVGENGMPDPQSTPTNGVNVDLSVTGGVEDPNGEQSSAWNGASGREVGVNDVGGGNGTHG